MKNRAKCKLCESIIESFHSEDFVYCKCKEIAVFGGEALYTQAKSYANFLRVDDEGHEIPVKYSEKKSSEDASDNPAEPQKDVTCEELMDELQSMIKAIEDLPKHEKFSFATNADLSYCILIILNIFKKIK